MILCFKAFAVWVKRCNFARKYGIILICKKIHKNINIQLN